MISTPNVAREGLFAHSGTGQVEGGTRPLDLVGTAGPSGRIAPVAELSPVPTGTRLGDLPALLRSLPRLDGEEAESFEADVDRARRELGDHLPEGRWES